MWKSCLILCLGLLSYSWIGAPNVAHANGHESIRYKPALIENLQIPREAITIAGRVLKDEGLNAFDEEALGKIPFYWVDQIFYNADYSQSSGSCSV